MEVTRVAGLLVSGLLLASSPAARAQEGTRPAPNPSRNAYFGDLHVHTSYSLDAYIFGTRNDPRAAYRYARGEELALAGGLRARRDVPLDFAAVTDHDIWLGELATCLDAESATYDTPGCKDIRLGESDPDAAKRAFRTLQESQVRVPMKRTADICGTDEPGPGSLCFAQSASIWQEIQKAAQEFYQPGVFTTFVAYEWSGSTVPYGMLHRNLIFRGSAVPPAIMSAIEHDNQPERLWEWLEQVCTGECRALAIPHNSNMSRALLFAPRNTDGSAWTRTGLERRARMEPVVEISQSKGDSECFPGLGSSDEACSFEQLYRPCGAEEIADPPRTARCSVPGDFVREALKAGLVADAEWNVNPFKLGIIASTDTHNALAGATEEEQFQGHYGLVDADPKVRLGLAPAPQGMPEWPVLVNSAGGLAGVWAEENTREAIWDALARRETFGTSGGRIRVRFFGGFDFPADAHRSLEMVQIGYAKGTPMGGTLNASAGKAPRFIVWATRDPKSAPLQKLQIVKGWLSNGKTEERVFDVACSDGLAPDAKTHVCADNGATVDLSSCAITPGKGAAELAATWTDPAFDPATHAFYYVRVLENPTCRWSTRDALRLGVPPPKTVPATVQERAWSSPIWLSPEEEKS